MNNVNLNIGGLIGAFVLGGIAVAIAFSVVDKSSGRGVYRLPLFGLVIGAFAGNFLWSYFFGKDDNSEGND
ncbi:hypothetical protein [Calycomorphotria hydatis]|uniref:Uncharacterized protein n=1 Tax=Calycomorphotria hydatis TaxID=2528027 RepID=A0A517T7T5_9PLAN|nr:hypothetical protein [Calycomorphotria hydatis]QDT64420.1 hypothetical protein V22_16540 [Calycomorphotria hydatis]